MKRLFFTLVLISIAIAQSFAPARYTGEAFAADIMPFWENDTVANSLSFNDSFGHEVVVGTYDPTTGLWHSSGGGVTSVGISVPSFLTVANSPITSMGTIAITATSEPQNLVLASPNGSSGAMVPRSLTTPDLSTVCTNGQTFFNNAGAIGCQTTAGTGTVTSVAVTVPTWLTVAGSPITTAGTFAITSTSEAQNLVLASPNGSSGTMAPRALVPADLASPCTSGQEFYNNAGAIGCQTPTVGTVTSAAMAVPGWLSVAGSPITSSGTFTITTPNQSANFFLASPSGGSGAMSPRAIVSADIATVLSSPPSIGNSAAGSGAFTTLTASGGVSGAGITALFASPPAIGGTAASTGKFTALGATSLGLNAAGMVGDGSTNNNSAFTTLLAAIAAGGEAVLPCGVFKLSTSFSNTITAGAHAELRGSGRDCTEIYFTGTTAGMTFTLGSQGSSLSIRDMAITTDDATGVNTAVILTSNIVTTGTNGGAQNDFVNVVLRGHDGYGVADYWGVGLSTITADNITIDRLGYYGAPAVVGTAIKTSSTSSTKFEAIVNVTNSIIYQCNKALEYGAFVQGVSIVSTNVTDCNYAVYVPAAETVLDQLSIVSSQFNCILACIDELSNVPNTMIIGNMFIINASSYGIAYNVAPTNLIVSNNSFGGVNTTNTIGINFGVTGGTGNIISSNSFNSLQFSINYAAGAAFVATGNTFTTITNAFNGSSSVIAYGNVPEASYTIAGLPACGAATFGVRLTINNGVASPTYHAAPSTTGAVWSPVYCTGGSTWAYD